MAAVKNRRERLINERVGLEEVRRVAQERLARLESFICSSLGGQGWKIKVLIIACLVSVFPDKDLLKKTIVIILLTTR